jgi:hypothetical protein
MDANETEEFFLKKYFCRPFNYKDYMEAVYFFCLNNHRSYSEALELIKKVENLPTVEVDMNAETRSIGYAMKEFTEEEDFLDYMENHRYSTEKRYRTAHLEVIKLLEKCKELANVKKNAALLRIIYGYDESLYKKGISKSKYLPRMMTINLPSKMKFSEITSKEKHVSHDTYRKALMILKFYHFYTSHGNYCEKAGLPAKFQEQSREFEIQMDMLLDKCGYVQTYVLNPFDQFLLRLHPKSPW